MTKGILSAVVLVGWMMAGSPVQAHHSLAATYDIKKEGKVTGVLTKVAFTNPHGAMTLEVENPDGTKTEWVMTTGSANTLANLGFGRNGPNTVKPGDRVTITYFAARNGKPLGFIRSITLPDQREIQISTGSASD
ncbi:MAG TPA: DUF6152 family protein [Gammaproteobacteria bacterium]